MTHTDPRTTRLPDSLCPLCGEYLSAATNVSNDDKPAAGDPTVCVYCGTVLLFDEHMKLQLMPDEVWRGLPAEDRAQLGTVRKAVLLMRRRR